MNLSGKKVLVVGLARSGRAAINILKTQNCQITLSDIKPPKDEIPNVEILDQSQQVAEQDFDLVIKNPGVHDDIPFMQEIYKRNIPVITEIELAYQLAKPQHFIAITGTNGKTTTSTLCYEILNKAYPGKVHLCGNIGIPLCEIVQDNNLMNQEGHIIVLEISNYQLVNIDKFHPEAATIINLSPDHIDVHGTLDAYYKSKTEVYRNMTEQDTFLLNNDDQTLKEYTEKYPIKAKTLTFSIENNKADIYVKDGNIYIGNEPVLNVNKIKIPGKHNLQNVMVAVALAKTQNVSNEVINEVVENFMGVEHRIEFVREVNGVRYYNDSKGTNTDATVTALKAFDRGVILLVGGFEKGLPMDDVKAHLTNDKNEQRVKKVIGFGACGPRLVRDLVGDEGIVVDDLPQAIREAVKIAEPKDIVLLSPTTSSFDQYSCFEERGEHFKKLVNEL
ncbi:MAG: UDP-N-acetylmuramoyl-L-alanine--D-glutamate ligase [Clostridia bacterium]|nr:UDP-N-acetylmuramoyl-L-alanine--D-glutamate ligase [Clostridia bacterium]